jgi:zinc/manganese transport system substrate-binding protein
LCAPPPQPEIATAAATAIAATTAAAAAHATPRLSLRLLVMHQKRKRSQSGGPHHRRPGRRHEGQAGVGGWPNLIMILVMNKPTAIKRSLTVVAAIAVAFALASAVAACGSSTSASGGRLNVVAAENFWGSLAEQLGGNRVQVASILTDPNADPHEYTSNPADARLMAAAHYVITNGAGYDTWTDKLLAANPSSARKQLDIAKLLRMHAGDNPHFWYDPEYVTRVMFRITADYKALDPAHAAYFDSRRTAVIAALAPYRSRISAIRATFAGAKVGSTESIFEYMAHALRLNLISPPEFMKAVAEGTEPPASTVVEFGRQLASRQAKVLVYNTQTSTAVTTNLKQQASSARIPIVGISESLQPSGASFQDWQVGQLDALTRALRATAGHP